METLALGKLSATVAHAHKQTYVCTHWQLFGLCGQRAEREEAEEAEAKKSDDR